MGSVFLMKFLSKKETYLNANKYPLHDIIILGEYLIPIIINILKSQSSSKKLSNWPGALTFVGELYITMKVNPTKTKRMEMPIKPLI